MMEVQDVKKGNVGLQSSPSNSVLPPGLDGSSLLILYFYETVLVQEGFEMVWNENWPELVYLHRESMEHRPVSFQTCQLLFWDETYFDFLEIFSNSLMGLV